MDFSIAEKCKCFISSLLKFIISDNLSALFLRIIQLTSKYFYLFLIMKLIVYQLIKYISYSFIKFNNNRECEVN